MADEKIDIKELAKKTRPQIEEVAVKLGLENASSYANKPAVLEAVERVQGGEAAAEVDASLKPDVPEGAGSDDGETADDQQADDKASGKPRKKSKNRNQGHPTEFDETGAPVY